MNYIDAPDDSDSPELAEESSAPELRSYCALAVHHGQRLDKVLVDAVPEFSRSYLQQLIEAACVQVQGHVESKPSRKIKAGELLSIAMRPTAQSQAFKPEAMDLRVVYQDEHLLVVDKPAGLVVHPAPGNWSGTLLNGLLAFSPEMALVPRAGIVHRLDKDTSGLMVVARTRSSMDALVAAIAAREVARQYLAVAHKPWQGAAQRRVDAPIGRDPRNRLQMAVVDLTVHAGKTAMTDFEWLGNAEQGCLVRCTLHTGRTHQIRVHMASIGHPLVSDAVYGGKTAGGLPRQALHAYQLGFKHPVTGVDLHFQSPLPGDIVALLHVWGLRYNG